jgi:hypothetical protein
MTGDEETAGPQTEDSAERGLVRDRRPSADPSTYAAFGRSESLDEDQAGDIADEGRGHRG